MNSEKQLERMAAILQAGIRIFIRYGYRLAQISEIAKEAGISKGSTYDYFASKEALFDFIIRQDLLKQTRDQWPRIPVQTPPTGSTLQMVREHLDIDALRTLIDDMLSLDCQDPKAELEQFVRVMYRDANRHRIAYSIIDRSANDWPQLAAIYQRVESETRTLQEYYIGTRIDQGLFRPLPSSTITAAQRYLECVQRCFAVARCLHPESDGIDETDAEEMAVFAVLHTFVPDRHC